MMIPLRRFVGICCVVLLFVVVFLLTVDEHAATAADDDKRQQLKDGVIRTKSSGGVVVISKEGTTKAEQKFPATEDDDDDDHRTITFDLDCHILGEGPGTYQDPTDTQDGGPVGKQDKQTLGRCRYKYPTRVPPNKGGYMEEVDWFFLRNHDKNNRKWSHDEREKCYLYCIDQLPKEEIDDELLIQAVRMGLSKVAEKLMKNYGLDPLASPSLGPMFGDTPGFNAIQEAIRGGYAESVKILSDSNYDLVIDNLGRTIKDYLTMNGSPIRPKDAMDILSLDTASSQTSTILTDNKHVDLGWNETTSFEIDETCDMDVFENTLSRQEFYNDYFMTGRPFLIRNMVPERELYAFSKQRWSRTTRFRPRDLVTVGPTAYPSMSDQDYCEHTMPIASVENVTECSSLPGVPMVHARHPTEEDWDELLPMYDGDVFNEEGGWRSIGQWFGPNPRRVANMGWQLFLGGDGSGATYHWHDLAFNVLYAGIKQWKIAPPKYRGWTGMPARQAAERVDDAVALKCIQRPGDLIVIPSYWGHLTLNVGFTIGAAVIIPERYQQMTNAKGW